MRDPPRAGADPCDAESGTEPAGRRSQDADCSGDQNQVHGAARGEKPSRRGRQASLLWLAHLG
jgi:hypothetical protein